MTLDLGRSAALSLQMWEVCLDLNAEIFGSMTKRGAPLLEQARARLNDYGPLLSLVRYDNAGTLLHHCRQVFESERAGEELGVVYSALANLEIRLEHDSEAVGFENRALRYTYLHGSPDNVALSHFNLSTYLILSSAGWRDVFGHRLAAAMIDVATKDGTAGTDLACLGSDLLNAGDQADAALPLDFASLCATVEQVEGVRFRELMTRFEPDEDRLNALLQNIIAKAREAT